MASQPGVPSPDQKAIQDLEKQLVRATGRQYRLPPGLSGITYKRIASQLAIHQEEANTSNENVGDLLISHIKILGIEPEPIAKPSPFSGIHMDCTRTKEDMLSRNIFEREFIASRATTQLFEHLEMRGTQELGNLHARVLPIIQSSGTGKSKAMYQAAATFFTFKFVLLSGDTSNTGYPKGSKALFDLLCRPGVFELNAIPEVQLLNAKIRLACVLLSTIELCRQKQDADPNLLDPKRWRDFVGSPEIVCDDVFFREVRTRVLELERGGRGSMKVYDCHLETLVNSLNQLQRAVKTVPHRQTIIFNIDEGHELAEGVSMACLLSVFADVKIKAKAPHLAVLTSTTSKLSTLAPKAAEEIPSSSGRWCPLDSRQLIQPWSYFGVNLDVEERSEFPTASVARTYDYQIRIGRPLWYAYFPRVGHNELLRLAQLKMTMKSMPSVTLQAALTCRLGLKLSPTAEGRELASIFVQHFMARAFYVHSSHANVEAGYGIEPILGAAAASIMKEAGHERWVRQLAGMADSSLIDKDQTNELLTKLAFVRAFDECQSIHSSEVSQGFFHPVTVLDMLHQLSGSSHEHLNQQRAFYSTGFVSTLADIAHVTCVISQFTKTVADDANATKLVDTQTIIQSILDCTGIEAPPRTEGIDILFAFVKDPHAPLEPSNIILCFGSGRNDAKCTHHPCDRFLQYCDLGFTVISILHQCNGGGQGQDSSFEFISPERESKRHKGEVEGALFYCEMRGAPSKLVNPEYFRLIAKRQAERFYDLGDVDPTSVDCMAPYHLNPPREELSKQLYGYFQKPGR